MTVVRSRGKKLREPISPGINFCPAIFLDRHLGGADITFRLAKVFIFGTIEHGDAVPIFQYLPGTLIYRKLWGHCGAEKEEID